MNWTISTVPDFDREAKRSSFIAVSDSDSGDIILLYIYDKSESPNIKTEYLKKLLNDLELI